MENYEIIWNAALEEMQSKISKIGYNTFIQQIKPVGTNGRKLVLSTTTVSFAEAIAQRYYSDIVDCIKNTNSGFTDVELRVGDSTKDYLAPYADSSDDTIDSMPINPDYTFEKYVVGSCNNFMFAAAKAVANNPGESYNPLFIYGGSGLGKTHMMHAIVNKLKKDKPLLNVLYSTCEKFTCDLISTIKQGDAYQENSEFRNKYRKVDVLLIDDVQFLARKESTQEAFFHMFNDLYAQRKQIILSADCHPREIKSLSDRLKTRFEGGLTAQVLPPDTETKIAIIQMKAEARNFIIPLDVALFLAEHSDDDVRSLEGLLNKVIFASMLHERPISLTLAENAIQETIGQKGHEEEVTADDILDTVCQYYHIDREDIKGKKKNKEFVEPRQICAYLMCDMLSIPLMSIGEALGGRDHTTVLHAKNKISELMQEKGKIYAEVRDLKNLILKK